MNRELLKKDLKDFRDSGGTWKDLSEKTGVPDATISRAASGKSQTDFDTWMKLHRGAPTIIRNPRTLRKAIQGVFRVLTSIEENGDSGKTITKSKACNDCENMTRMDNPRFVYVYEIGGYPMAEPVGRAFRPFNVPEDIEIATLILEDDSMAPEIGPGSYIYITPSIGTPKNGTLCFVIWKEGNKEHRAVRRFQSESGIIILKPDNPKWETRIITQENIGTVQLFIALGTYKCLYDFG